MAPALADTATDLASEIARLSAILDLDPGPHDAVQQLEQERDALAVVYLRDLLRTYWP